MATALAVMGLIFCAVFTAVLGGIGYQSIRALKKLTDELDGDGHGGKK